MVSGSPSLGSGMVPLPSGRSNHSGTTTSVYQGTWLSEAILWAVWSHQGTLTVSMDNHTLSTCRLLVLDSKRFQSIVGALHSDHATNYARIFVEQLNRQSIKGHALSDIGENDALMAKRIDVAFPMFDAMMSSEDDSEEEEDEENREPSDENKALGSEGDEDFVSEIAVLAGPSHSSSEETSGGDQVGVLPGIQAEPSRSSSLSRGSDFRLTLQVPGKEAAKKLSVKERSRGSSDSLRTGSSQTFQGQRRSVMDFARGLFSAGKTTPLNDKKRHTAPFKT